MLRQSLLVSLLVAGSPRRWPPLPARARAATSASRSTARPARSTRSPTSPGVEVGHDDADRGRRQARGRQGPGPHRRHRGPAARQGLDPGLRRLVLAQRQRRDDRHDLGRGVRLPRRPGRDHQHAQRRASCATRSSHWRVAARAGGAAGTGGRCRSSPRPTTAASTTSTASTSSRSTSSRRSTARAGRAGRGGQRRRRHRHDLLRLQGRHRHRLAQADRRRTAATPSACWCSATTARAQPAAHRRRPGRPGDRQDRMPSRKPDAEHGSIIIVVATDAPLLPHQLKRLARRVPLGLGRDGQRRGQRLGRHLHRVLHRQPRAPARPTGTAQLTMLPNERMDPLFEATVAGDRGGDRQRDGRRGDMTGIDGHHVRRAAARRAAQGARQVPPAHW